MSAQYRPYRDEESVDSLETTSWTDNEPGTIQIYEKTTEELPYAANRKALWFQVALFTFAGTLGFVLGYFGHFHQTETAVGLEENAHLSSSGHSDYHEDPTIKDRLLTQIDGHNIYETLTKFKDYDRTPGSDGNHQFAAYIHNLFNEFGFDPVTMLNNTFKTMLPKQGSIVSMLDKENRTIYSTYQVDSNSSSGSSYNAEPFLPLSQAEETIITTDQLLYMNKGLKEDYTKLPSLGLNHNDTEGKVFVIRQTFYQAHDVVINAQESGAAAILLFPDPDTFGSSSPFPKSVQLPNDAARSHPLAWSNYGDLATLNVSSKSAIDVTKLGLPDKESKVHIPVVLISFETAKKLLFGLSGAQAPSDWNCFEFTLHIGPGYREENGVDARNKIRIEFHNQETAITTTTITGIIEGAVEPDRYVIIGSRRDSLNRGLLDSVSGTAVMLEVARVYGLLLKQGWRPRRTIIFNSFGAESFNLIGSSNWLETHQRLLHSRAVSYINCDLVVTGNHSVTISASPLLFQVLYNATRQVANPNYDRSGGQGLKTVYDAWTESHKISKLDELLTGRYTSIHQLDELLGKYGTPMSEQPTSNGSETGDTADSLAYNGDILREYKKSATVMTRPKVKRLDLQSIYSPFFIYAGIPVVDVRHTGFLGNVQEKTNLLEDTLPLLGTKYDNLAALQLIDPDLKYHVAVGQVLSEILRDLSESVFLPFNLLDYAVTLGDSYAHLVTHYGKTFAEMSLDLETLKKVIHEFTLAAAKFHSRQDRVNLKDAFQVRKFNDQMMLLERAFLDPSGLPNHWERKHIILAPHDGQDHRGGFPGLVDWITLLEGESIEDPDSMLFMEVLKVHYKVVIYTIASATRIIEDVHVL